MIYQCAYMYASMVSSRIKQHTSVYMCQVSTCYHYPLKMARFAGGNVNTPTDWQTQFIPCGDIANEKDETHPFSSLISGKKKVIFHSDVSLPEGNRITSTFTRVP